MLSSSTEIKVNTPKISTSKTVTFSIKLGDINKL